MLSNPTISDYEFDKLLNSLIALEKKHPQYFDSLSPTQRIGSDINEGFKQEPHNYPMFSLRNTYSIEEIKEHHERTTKLLQVSPNYVCELKYDGVSINLFYKNGKLERALTRGDGLIGDNVTNNIKTIKSIPLKLRNNNYPAEFEIRGEVIMPFDVFEQLNLRREKQEKSVFANPRNAASGSLKLLNSSIVAKRNLECYFYQIVGENLTTTTQYESLQHAKKWGFLISPEIKKCNSIGEVINYIFYWENERKSLNEGTDGVVVKINSLENQKKLSNTAKFPRWAVAFKYKTETTKSKLLSIDYQVGRTGIITPVANLEKVFLSGTFVKRATLHNESFMSDLDLREGDVVIIEKGGEIIPKVLGIDKTHRLLNSEKIEFIKTCPACNALLIKDTDKADYFCPNEHHCPPQIKGKIFHFTQRKAMRIEFLGKETIELLYNHNLVRNIANLYTLRETDLIPLERLGEKSAENIIKSITDSKNAPFHRVLYGLGIRYVGETVAKILAENLESLHNLRTATFEELINIDEIGDKIAKSILSFFDSPSNQQLIKQLQDHGLQFTVDKQVITQNKNTKLQGLTIVITGVFNNYSREELKNIILQNGGKITSAISKKTAYLVKGDNPGNSKLEKAQKNKISILSEMEFQKLLNK